MADEKIELAQATRLPSAKQPMENQFIDPAGRDYGRLVEPEGASQPNPLAVPPPGLGYGRLVETELSPEEKRELFLSGLYKGAVQSFPSAVALLPGAKLGFEATSRVPYIAGLPMTGPAGLLKGTAITLGTLGGAMTGIIGASPAGDYLYEAAVGPEVAGASDPKKLPYIKAGEAISGSLLFSLAGFGINPKNIQTGYRVLDFLMKTGPYARKNIMTYGLGETAAATGAGVGEYYAQTTGIPFLGMEPGSLSSSLALQTLGGVIAPPQLLIKVATPFVDLVKKAVGTRVSKNSRENAAANRFISLIEEQFEPELRKNDPTAWNILYTTRYLPELINKLETPGLVPGMTTAQQSEDLTMSIIERTLADQNKVFGRQIDQQTQLTHQAIAKMIQGLNASGDPAAIQAAAQLRNDYVTQMLQGRLATADAASALAISRITQDTPANREIVGNIIRDNTFRSVDNARDAEQALWSLTPKKLNIEKENLAAQLRKNGASDEEIQVALRKFVDKQSLIPSNFVRTYDQFLAGTADVFVGDIPPQVRQLVEQMKSAKSLKGMARDQIMAYGRDASPTLKDQADNLEQTIGLFQTQIKSGEQKLKTLRDLIKSKNFEFTMVDTGSVPEGTTYKWLFKDLTGQIKDNWLDFIRASAGLGDPSVLERYKNNALTQIKGKDKTGKEIVFSKEDLSSLFGLPNVRTQRDLAQTQLANVEKQVFEAGQEYVRQGAKSVGDLIVNRGYLLKRAREAEASTNERMMYAFYVKLADALKRDIDQVQNPAYDEAKNFSKAFNDVYTRTFAGKLDDVDITGASKIPAELVVRKAFSGGADYANIRLNAIQDAINFLPQRQLEMLAAGSRAADLPELVRGVNEAGNLLVSTTDGLNRMVRFVAGQTAGQMDQAGKLINIDPQKLTTFIANNERLIQDFPGLFDDLSNAARASNYAKLVADQTSALNQRVRYQAAFTRFLGENPTEAVGRALSHGPDKNPSKDFGDLIRAARTGMKGKTQLQALRGQGIRPGGVLDPVTGAVVEPSVTSQDLTQALQSGVYDWAWAKAGGSTNNFSGTKYFDAFFAPMSKGRPSVMDIAVNNGLFSRSEASNLRDMLTRIKNIELVSENKMVVDQLLSGAGAIEDLFLRVVGGKFGKDIAGNQGPTLLAASAGSRYVRDVASRLPMESQRMILEQAARDPAFAAQLLRRGRSEADKLKFARSMHGYLYNAGLTRDEPPPEEKPQAPEPLSAAQMLANRKFQKVAPPTHGLFGNMGANTRADRFLTPKPVLDQLTRPVAPPPQSSAGSARGMLSRYELAFPNDPLVSGFS